MKFVQIICFITALMFNNIAAAAVSEAPAFKLPALQGEVELAKLRGKVVYLDFWASWCIPCRKSFPWMNEMMATYKDQGLEIVAVNLDKDKKQADAFLKKVEAHFTIAFDQQGDSAKAYKLRGMPSSYLIGRDGKLYASHIGFRDKDKPIMEQAIQQLLKQ
ncbi:MAG: TlpA family protein disulfide reductase [Thiotrichaceae bacterium]|nr:TlpA family protein disulfide reductase [Thiotrichaceae bacterium]